MKKYIKPQAIALTAELEVSFLSDSNGIAIQSTEDNSTTKPGEGIGLSKDFGYDLSDFNSFDPWEDIQ